MSTEEGTVAALSQVVSIQSMRDIGTALQSGVESGGLLLDESNLAPAFFDLRSGLAGELFQKCVNYRVRLAIVVAAPGAHGDRFSELVHEHRSHAQVRFFTLRSEAQSWLSAQRRRS